MRQAISFFVQKQNLIYEQSLLQFVKICENKAYSLKGRVSVN